MRDVKETVYCEIGEKGIMQKCKKHLCIDIQIARDFKYQTR